MTLIYVFLAEEDLNSGNTVIPIHLRAKFLLETKDGFTWQYDFIGNKRRKPVDLESFDEYYYDINSHKFYRDRHEISSNKIIEQIYQLHMKPTYSFRGFKLRTRLNIQKISTNLLKGISHVSSRTHSHLYGKKEIYRNPFEKYIQKQLWVQSKEKGEKIETTNIKI